MNEKCLKDSLVQILKNSNSINTFNQVLLQKRIYFYNESIRWKYKTRLTKHACLAQSFGDNTLLANVQDGFCATPSKSHQLPSLSNFAPICHQNVCLSNVFFMFSLKSNVLFFRIFLLTKHF